MKLEDHDLETIFQTGLMQNDHRPAVKSALIELYRRFGQLLCALVRADARERRLGK